MNLFDRLGDVLFGTAPAPVKKQPTIDEIEERARKASQSSVFGALTFGGGSTYTQEKSLKLSAVYCAVEMISNGIAQLPFEPYAVDDDGYKTKLVKHPLWHILNCQPNQRMTRHTFVKTLVSSVLLTGNGYAYIERDESGKIVKGLHYIPTSYVTIVPPSRLDEPVSYQVVGLNGTIPHTDMIHILNYSVDGVIGISTLQHAAMTLGLAMDSEVHAANFFESGAAVGGVLSVDAALTDKQKREIKSSWQQAFGHKHGGQTNGVAVLEGSMKYSPISINPTDAQLLESRQFNIPEIARFFLISPTKLFDYTHASYNTLEATNLSFLTDTLQPMMNKLEMEFERKLFAVGEHPNREIKFDVSALLRTDKAGLANYYRTLWNLGAMTTNEVRKAEGLPKIDNGDEAFVPVNLQTLSKAVVANPNMSGQVIKDALNDEQPPVEEQPQTDEPAQTEQ